MFKQHLLQTLNALFVLMYIYRFFFIFGVKSHSLCLPYSTLTQIYFFIVPINKSQNCTHIGCSCATVKMMNCSIGIFGPTFFYSCDTSLIRSLFVNPDQGINLTRWHGSTRNSEHQIRLPVGVLCIRSVNVWLFAWAARVRRPVCHNTNPDEDETYDQRGLRVRLSYSLFKTLKKNNLSKNRKCVYFIPATRIQQEQ